MLVIAVVVTAYLALGSNLGDRAALVRKAAEMLGGHVGVRVEAASALFETEAVAPTPQPAYLNAALRVRTALDARSLLAVCLLIERALGRVRPVGTGPAPRPIDIDLLLHGTAVHQEPGLVVPHPRLLERGFVRIPLAEVAAPGLRHPVSAERLDVARPHPHVQRLGG